MINNQYLYLVSTIFRTSSPHLSSVSPVTLLRPDGLQAWYCFTQVANFLREKNELFNEIPFVQSDLTPNRFRPGSNLVSRNLKLNLVEKNMIK